jgi:hypothetical protein
LGPAVIKNAVYRMDDKCVSATTDDRRTFLQENYAKITNYIGNGFGSLIDTIKWTKEFKATPGARVAIPVPSQVIGADKQIIIYKMFPEFANELNAKLWELGPQVHRGFVEKFMRHALSIPLNIRYCSMSGAYCYTSSPETNKPCPLLP